MLAFYNFESNQFYSAFQYLEAEPNSITQSAPTNTMGACSVVVLTQSCMVAQLDPSIIQYQ